uniref:Integrase catalytic domain-containing protein n=1 Tax=Triticum urartu TaxID=4572 RepID=A0A8R7Q3H5_TRIUA
MKNIFRLHGLPLAIISDRDRIFTSTIWQELFKLSQTQLRLSSSYHPQTDGQTERVNQCLEGYLRCAVHSCPGNWIKWLFLAEYWYNTTFHSSLGRTPFEVIYGHLPREFAVTQVEESSVPDLATWLQEREVMAQHLQQQLKHAQDRMKAQADKHRTDRSFEVGDMVFLKLQPHIQTSVAQRPYQKLAFRYYGPYQVLARIGKVAYKLQLPVDSKIHSVVHVSQLKKAVGPSTQVSCDLPPVNSILQAEHQPEAILDTKFIRVRGEMQPRLLVQWGALPASLATWEEPAELRRRFPAASAWGQASPQGGEDVTTVKVTSPANKREEQLVKALADSTEGPTR